MKSFGQRKNVMFPGSELHRSLPHAGFLEITRWFFARRKRFRIIGDSMFPLLHSGTDVLIQPTRFLRDGFSPGDIVVFNHPYRRDFKLVKMIKEILPNGTIHVTGVNSKESTDSAVFGVIDQCAIVGKVTAIF